MAEAAAIAEAEVTIAEAEVMEEEAEDSESSQSDHDAVVNVESDSEVDSEPGEPAKVAAACGNLKGYACGKGTAVRTARPQKKKAKPAPATNSCSASFTLGSNHAGRRGTVPLAARSTKSTSTSLMKSPPELLTQPPTTASTSARCGATVPDAVSTVGPSVASTEPSARGALAEVARAPATVPASPSKLFATVLGGIAGGIANAVGVPLVSVRLRDAVSQSSNHNHDNP